MAKKKRMGGGGGGARLPMPGMGGMGAMGGMGGLMSQMQKLQADMEKAQAELADEEISVTAGGGMISVVISGQQEFRSIKINPAVVDPDDVEMLEDLVLAAVTEAMQKAKEIQEERMGGLTGGLGLPPGLGF